MKRVTLAALPAVLLLSVGCGGPVMGRPQPVAGSSGVDLPHDICALIPESATAEQQLIPRHVADDYYLANDIVSVTCRMSGTDYMFGIIITNESLDRWNKRNPSVPYPYPARRALAQPALDGRDRDCLLNVETSYGQVYTLLTDAPVGQSCLELSRKHLDAFLPYLPT